MTGKIIAEWSEDCGRGRRRDRDRQPRRARGASRPAISPASFSCMSSAPPGTISSNTRSICSAGPEARRTARCPARTTRMPGRPTAMPDCRRRRRGERVILWVQNSHPTPIPAGAIGLNPMGEERVVALAEPLGPFASRAVDVAELLPDLRWPRQIELRAGKHVVRPRYEVLAGERRRIAHVNVERADLLPDPELPDLAALLGKGYLLPAPILPGTEWESVLLPTPMALSQTELPLAALVYDRDGKRSGATSASAGCRAITRRRCARRVGDGARRRLRPCRAGLRFRAHGGERRRLAARAVPLSPSRQRPCRRDQLRRACLQYAAGLSRRAAILCRPAAGLSTRLFLRLGDGAYDTLCHLIYPASRPWRPVSATEIILHDRLGREVARAALAFRAPDRACSAIASCSTPRRAPAPATAPTRSSATQPAVCSGITACWVATARSASTTCSAFDRELTRTPSGPVAAAAKNAILSCRIDEGPGAAARHGRRASQQGPDHRRRAGRLHGGDLCRARQSASRCWSPGSSRAGSSPSPPMSRTTRASPTSSRAPG